MRSLKPRSSGLGHQVTSFSGSQENRRTSTGSLAWLTLLPVITPLGQSVHSGATSARFLSMSLAGYGPLFHGILSGAGTILNC